MQIEESLAYNKKVLVIGGGVGGIKAALDLAEAGRDVVLIDKAPSIGGLMTQLDRTFPTNNCDLCTLSPHLSESGRNLHIELLSMTQLTAVEGEAGNFTVTLRSRPRYIDLEKCTACGLCHQEFGDCVRFTPGLDHRAPTCMRYPRATPYSFSIDLEKCQDVEALIRVCPSEAIIPDETENIRSEKVGAVVVATGAELFDPSVLDNFGYGKYDDVVTSLDYERILSASGPTGGELLRPSDGKPPRRVAWIQCVGSRGFNRADVPYCSSACCMYALKEAIVTRERFSDEIETVIYYMDMRTFGKDYERYLQRAQDDYGVQLIRSRPHSILPAGSDGDLVIAYTNDDSTEMKKEAFDMVVLSVGFRISSEMAGLADVLGIELNTHNFVKTSSFSPVSASRPGIYVCGLFESPKDIPETIVQASAAACLAAGHVTPAAAYDQTDAGAWELEADDQDELPPERDVSQEEPRIGVFVCDCGQNIGGVVDLPEVIEYARVLPQVAVAETIGHGCSSQSLVHLQEAIREQNLNRVVIGGCSPRTHETKFQDALRKAGLNKYLVQMANIRDQDTWVHPDQPREATDKAKDLIRMAVFGVAQAHPLADYTLPINKNVLVVGGGVTGMNAALKLADQGRKVYLIERAAELGGVARSIRRTLEGEDVQAYVKELIERTQRHEGIQVLTHSLVVDHSGGMGMFKTGVQTGPRMRYQQIEHGVTILATGALAHRPQEYMLGEHEAVVNQLDLDDLLEAQPDKINSWESVVMIQCVGSRCPENPNCSRVCCQTAIKNALRIKALNPEARIFILNRDIRTYGFQEDYYRMAREQGVIFVRYEPDRKPRVKADGQKIEVTFDDPIVGRELSVAADCLVLSTGMIADDENTEDLGMIFHLPRTEDGYFLEDHVKLRPVDLPVPGFFVAGTAHAPKSIRESISQAQAAAGRAQTMLARETINLGAAVARVNGDLCAACLICVRACPFDVPYINADGYSEIDPAKCHGCGICAAECPAKAIQLMQYEDDQIMAGLTGLFERIA